MAAWQVALTLLFLMRTVVFALPEVVISLSKAYRDRQVLLKFCVATGLGTSIDAMAVGVGLAFINVDILTVAAAIGFSTFVMVTLGVMLGKVLGTLTGKRAEIAGGVILILIGTTILVEHLSAGP